MSGSVRSPQGRRWRPATAAFTLIELVVVLVLLAVVLALAAPALQAGFRNRELASTVRRIATLCRHARNAAVARVGALDVVIMEEEGRVELREPPGGSAVEEGEEPPADDRPRQPPHVDLPESVAIAAIEGGLREPPWDREAPVRLRFYPNGSTSGLRLVLANRDDPQRFRYELEVDLVVGTITIGVPEETS